jgi:hypothetical protein
MNEKLKELAHRAGLEFATNSVDMPIIVAVKEGKLADPKAGLAEFAKLIVQEHVNLLRQEWYELNNAPEVENESPRDIGLRVGKKGEIIVLMEKIKQHFGVEE